MTDALTGAGDGRCFVGLGGARETRKMLSRIQPLARWPWRLFYIMLL